MNVTLDFHNSNTFLGAISTPAEVLRRLGAKRLSFICLTHPHKDHFSGMVDVISEFAPDIDMFYSCPLGDLLNRPDRLKRLARNLQRIRKETDGFLQRKAALEFCQILKWASGLGKKWEECGGFESRIGPLGFGDVRITVLQPPRTVNGDFVSRIEREDPTILGSFNENALSLAIQFEYCGSSIILGGTAQQQIGMPETVSKLTRKNDLLRRQLYSLTTALVMTTHTSLGASICVIWTALCHNIRKRSFSPFCRSNRRIVRARY